MTTFKIGRQAEAVAAIFLQSKGCTILDRNWRTRWCEIDLIAQRSGCIFLCEVKYRRSKLQGTGLDYITPRKLQRMSFASELWVARHNWTGDYQLVALEVSGLDFRVTAAIKLLD